MDPGSAPSLALFLAPGDASTPALSACDGRTSRTPPRGPANAASRSSLECAAEPPIEAPSADGYPAARGGLTRATHTPMPRRRRARGDVREQRVLVPRMPSPPPPGNNGGPGPAVGGKPRTRPESAASRSAAAEPCALSTSLGPRRRSAAPCSSSGCARSSRGGIARAFCASSRRRSWRSAPTELGLEAPERAPTAGRRRRPAARDRRPTARSVGGGTSSTRCARRACP